MDPVTFAVLMYVGGSTTLLLKLYERIVTRKEQDQLEPSNEKELRFEPWMM